jgi:hypothetical protein
VILRVVAFCYIMSLSSRAVQQNIQESRRQAGEWAKSLQFKEAALDLLVLPFYIISYVVGFIWFAIKYMVGILVVGFQSGSRKERS